ncbi:hypothetical protein ACUNV4_16230 [Granulosicoccus sp. 3-233]|uniref:hypothetical protein n=1 Tax=Granulosicoccus sp. 3-233 TaxID=3417969 RepID=UPI003D352DE6
MPSPADRNVFSIIDGQAAVFNENHEAGNPETSDYREQLRRACTLIKAAGFHSEPDVFLQDFQRTDLVEHGPELDGAPIHPAAQIAMEYWPSVAVGSVDTLTFTLARHNENAT